MGNTSFNFPLFQSFSYYQFIELLENVPHGILIIISRGILSLYSLNWSEKGLISTMGKIFDKKIKKSNKVGQDQKRLISVLTTITNI